jgi:hypothetical protein
VRIEVTRYRKRDGFPTRHWAVFVDGELLVVTLYRKGAEAVATPLTGVNDSRPIRTRDEQDDASPAP